MNQTATVDPDNLPELARRDFGAALAAYADGLRQMSGNLLIGPCNVERAIELVAPSLAAATFAAYELPESLREMMRNAALETGIVVVSEMSGAERGSDWSWCDLAEAADDEEYKLHHGVES